MAKYEVEIRGYLSKKQFKNLKSFLDKNAVIGKKQKQIAIFLDGSQSDKIGTLQNSKMRFALQVNNGESSLKVKLGHASLTGRQEIELNLGKTPIVEIFAFLETVGFQKGAVRPVYRQNYYYKRIDISLKNKCLFGDHFEFETKVSYKSELKNAGRKLRVFARKFSLNTLTEKEYLDIILDIYKKHPPTAFKEILADFKLE